MKDKEIWKNVSKIGVVTDGRGKLIDLTPFDDYWVSSFGRVYNSDTKRFLPSEGKGYIRDGYRQIALSKQGEKQINIKVHRLVAYAFLDNPNGYTEINHLNEAKDDNRVVNLEWMSHLDNCRYGTRTQRSAEKQSKQVFQYDLNGNLIRIWQSTNECGRNGFHKGAISDCCNNKFNRNGNNVYKGFIWSYEQKKAV